MKEPIQHSSAKEGHNNTKTIQKRSEEVLHSEMEMKDVDISLTKSTTEQWFKPKKGTNLPRFSGFKSISEKNR